MEYDMEYDARYKSRIGLSGVLMPRRIPIRFLTFALALTTIARAQAPIKVSVNEVIVPVTVTDEKGRFVSNLTRDDFKIFDENKEQKIDFFSHEPSQPIVIGFLIDTSNGMKITGNRKRKRLPSPW